MIKNEYSKMKDYELMKLLKDTSCSNIMRNKILTVLWERYQPQVHKHWWTLQRQMNNIDAVNAMKDDYYMMAEEAFLTAIDKIDMSKAKENFKCIQMINWYLTNVRTKIIKKIKKTPMTKSISYMNNLEEDSMKVDNDVETAYWEDEGYKDEPSYVAEKNEQEEKYRKVIKECMKKWTQIEIDIFNEMLDGKKKSEISSKFDISVEKVNSEFTKIKGDLKSTYKKFN